MAEVSIPEVGKGGFGAVLSAAEARQAGEILLAAGVTRRLGELLRDAANQADQAERIEEQLERRDRLELRRLDRP